MKTMRMHGMLSIANLAKNNLRWDMSELKQTQKSKFRNFPVQELVAYKRKANIKPKLLKAAPFSAPF